MITRHYREMQNVDISRIWGAWYSGITGYCSEGAGRPVSRTVDFSLVVMRPLFNLEGVEFGALLLKRREQAIDIHGLNQKPIST